MNIRIKPSVESIYNAELVLVGVAPLFEYTENERTDKQIGFKYSLVEQGYFDKLIVKILTTDSEPAISQEEIESAQEEGKHLYVTLTNSKCTFYVAGSGDNRHVALSISADAIEVAAEK